MTAEEVKAEWEQKRHLPDWSCRVCGRSVRAVDVHICDTVRSQSAAYAKIRGVLRDKALTDSMKWKWLSEIMEDTERPIEEANAVLAYDIEQRKEEARKS